MTRSYEIPVRVADKFFIEDRDGNRREIDEMTFFQIKRLWDDCGNGYGVYMANRLDKDA